MRMLVCRSCDWSVNYTNAGGKKKYSALSRLGPKTQDMYGDSNVLGTCPSCQTGWVYEEDFEQRPMPPQTKAKWG